MANYNLDLFGVADSTAVNTLTASTGQTHSGGASFQTINGRMYNSNGADGWMDISGDFPDTFSFDLDMHFLDSLQGNMGFAFAANAAHTEYMLIASYSGNVILYHRTGGSFNTLHSEPVGVAAGNDLPLIHIEVSPTAVSFSYGGTEVYSATRTTNSETYTKCAWRCTLAQSNAGSTHVNSIALVDPAAARNYVTSANNVLLLPANVNKTYADGVYAISASVLDTDGTTATDTSTLSVGFGIAHDAAMAHGTDFAVTVSNPAVTPTDANSTLSTGSVSLVPVVTGSAPTFTLTYSISRLDLQEGSYTWTQTVGAETANTSSLAYTIDGNGTSEYYGTVAALTGAWAKPEYSALATGDNVYAIRTAGTGAADVTNGAFPENSTWTIYIQDQTDDTWGAAGTIVSPAADTTAPTVQILNAPASVSDTSAFNVTVEFSEDVTGFVVGDISVTNATLSNFVAVDGNTYTVDVTPDEGGNIAINVGAAVAQDAAANDNTAASQVTVTYVVVDVTAPVITILGSNPAYHNVLDLYVDAGATATDNIDGDITADISVVNIVNRNVTGTYTVRYNVSDAEGNAAVEAVRTVHVQDLEAPVITLNGSASIDHPIGVPYSDPGATAFDSYDGDVTADILANNTVNRNVEGTYQVIYDVADSAGNDADQVIRTVNVLPSLDSTPPVITMFGVSPVYVENGSIYNDAGARADDDTDGVITNDITTVNPVNTSINGTYTVRYNVSDAAGNDAEEVTRTVIVGDNPDTTIPVITLSGPLTTYVNYGSSYVEPGYSASDDVDGVITGNVVVTNPVNTSIIGAYTVRYNVQDSAGNDASERTRTVIVQSVGDVEAPVISLIGGAEIEIPLGEPYVDAGATASDNLDGNISANIIVSNSVNVNQVGTYSVVYNVVDSNGNYATPVIRTVIVISDTAPRITINGPKVFYVDQNATFADAGANVTSYVDGNTTIYAPETVDTSELGNTVLTYSYTDGDGDSADTQYRTVVVRDPNQAVVYIDAGSSILQPIITSIKG